MREVGAAREPLIGIFRQRRSKHRIESGQLGTGVGQHGWRGVEVTAYRDRRIGMRKQLQSSKQVVGGGCQGVLVSTTVDLFTHQLLGCGVGHRPDGHIGRGESTDVIDAAGNAEVGQQDSLFGVVIEMGEHEVGRFDVAVQ